MCKVTQQQRIHTFVTNERKKNGTKNSSTMHHFFDTFIVSFLHDSNHNDKRFFKFLKRSLFINIFAKLIIERRFLTKKEILLFFMNNYSAFHSLFHHTIINDMLTQASKKRPESKTKRFAVILEKQQQNLVFFFLLQMHLFLRNNRAKYSHGWTFFLCADKFYLSNLKQNHKQTMKSLYREKNQE